MRENQPKQTGSNEKKKGICEIHDKAVEWSYKLNDFVCPDCEEEKIHGDNVKKAFMYLSLPPRLNDCSFDNYNPQNKKSEKILERCKDYASTISILKNGLIMIGGVGTGKTHLAVAICKKVCMFGFKSKISTVPEIIRDIRSSWKGEATDSWGNKRSEDDILRDYSFEFMLVIDEIGSQYGSDSEKITISEIINNRYNNMLPTILIGNVTLSEAEKYLGKRAIDRVKDNGKILVFDWESYRKPQD